MTDAKFLREAERSIHEIDSQAEVWLFGSRARGHAREDSDQAFVVVTDKLVNRAYKRLVRNNMFYPELDSERVTGTIIQNKSVWRELEITHLHQNASKEGSVL